MKQLNQFLTLLGLLILLSAQATAQVIYVKSNAAGNNDGTSWTNAYTTLTTAVAAAGPDNEIWVSAGTYKPDVNSTFLLAAGAHLYGGFSGAETALGQRNPVANLTTLSGDLNGDDSPTDLTINRTDNVNHVLWVSGTDTTKRSIIDGFTIRNGNTKVLTADPTATKQGAGILVKGRASIYHCRFQENSGLFGGGVAAIGPEGANVLVDNCVFDNNYSTSSCAGVYIQSALSGQVNKCTFTNNTTNRGCMYPNACKNILIDSCLFENNKQQTTGLFGTAMFTWQSSFTTSNCVFRGNTGATAVGMYNDGRDGGNSFVVDNCLFENNTSTGNGASIYNWQANFTIKNSTFRNNASANGAGIQSDGREGGSSFTIDNCTFENNTTTGYGGTAVYNFKTDCEVLNCSFTGNTAPNAAAMYNGAAKVLVKGCLFENGEATFGGALSNFSEGGEVTLEETTFSNNSAVTSGGAVINGFLAALFVKNCTFESNTANFGGAIFNQNDSTALTVEGTLFNNNNADTRGGAIHVSSGITTNISTSVFSTNTANFGGAVAVEEDSLDLGILNMDRCEFRENLAFTQAAALNVDNVDATLTNCLFALNQNFGPNPGGAISNNGAGGKTSRIHAVNCTFADNTATSGSGIAQYEDATGSAELTLQNNIFSNGGDNYAIEEGTPEVFSLGGNLSADGTMTAYLTGTNDLNNTDPLFVDAGVLNFHLQAGSPCINKGIAAGAPTVDIEGYLRVGLPDMGSFEFGTSGTHAALQTLPLQLMPNPSTDFVQASLENDWTGAVTVSVIDLSGKLVRSLNLEKTGTDWMLRVDLKNLPQGAYVATVKMGSSIYVGRIVKQ